MARAPLKQTNRLLMDSVIKPRTTGGEYNTARISGARLTHALTLSDTVAPLHGSGHLGIVQHYTFQSLSYSITQGSLSHSVVPIIYMYLTLLRGPELHTSSTRISLEQLTHSSCTQYRHTHTSSYVRLPLRKKFQQYKFSQIRDILCA